MPLTVTEPATLAELAKLCPPVTLTQWGVVREVWRNGRSWAIRDESGALIAVAGATAFGNGFGEFWFHFAPEARKRLISLARLVRLTLKRLPYADAVTLCTSKEGERFAAACGMNYLAQIPEGVIYHGKCRSAGRHHEDRRFLQGAAGRGERGGTAGDFHAPQIPG